MRVVAGGQVRCGWDPEARRRREVALPDLAPDQRRRACYLYPSDTEAQARLAKMDAQADRLAAKKARVQELDGSVMIAGQSSWAPPPPGGGGVGL